MSVLWKFFAIAKCGVVYFIEGMSSLTLKMTENGFGTSWILEGLSHLTLSRLHHLSILPIQSPIPPLQVSLIFTSQLWVVKKPASIENVYRVKLLSPLVWCIMNFLLTLLPVYWKSQLAENFYVTKHFQFIFQQLLHITLWKCLNLFLLLSNCWLVLKTFLLIHRKLQESTNWVFPPASGTPLSAGII